MRVPSDFPTTPRRQVGPGTRLNGIYEIDGLIATGGMGEVYRGRAIETGIKVAIKMIRADMTENETVLALFRKEAAALHNLQNDAVVRYYVFTTDPELNSPYLAMEFVEGESLSDILQNGPLPLETVRLLQKRLGSALDAAHRTGVVHRDISPDNIILPGGDAARAKLIDFGIARSAFGGGTVIGDRFAGKANFASPEQVGLYGGAAGAPADIYSLGLVLAACLLGSPLDMGGTQLDVIRKRQKLPDLRSIDASIRPLIAWMLQPDPKDRPPSMAEVAAWHPPSSASRRGGGAGGARKWLLPAGIAAVVAFGIGIGVVGSRFMSGSPLPGVIADVPRPAPVARQEAPRAPETARPEPPRQEIARPLPPAAPPADRPAPPAERQPDPQAAARVGPSVSEPPRVPEIPVPSVEPPAPTPAPSRIEESSPAPGIANLPPMVADPPARPEGPRPAAVPAEPPPVIASTAPKAPAVENGVFRDCPTCPAMVIVPAGRFRMGGGADPSEKPARDVSVGRFAAGRFPVTAVEWRRCFNDKGCAYDPGGDPDAPVHNLSFDDVKQYVAWLSRVSERPYRLLSEAEWEYAARGGAATRYWWGDLFRAEMAPCKGCSTPAPRSPPKVGSFRENAFGLFDVTGSVAQWVEDCWHATYRGAPRDAAPRTGASCRERVLRGGSWMSEPADLRVGSRSFYDASVRYPGHGVRVARDL